MVKSKSEVKMKKNKASAQFSPSTSMMKKKYKGVRMRSWGSFVSEIRAPNQKTRIWLGSYSTPEAAARAYDAALICLKGTSANLNFPFSQNSYNNISCDTVLSPKSIQKIAAAAANGFLDTPPATSSTETASSPIEDDVSLVSSLDTSWYNFDSPKYNDGMLNGGFFDQFTMEDFYEENDISLWSFC